MTDSGTLDGRKIRAIVKQANREKAKIAAARDRLRDLSDELNAICDDCDEAVSGLDQVADVLSKYI